MPSKKYIFHFNPKYISLRDIEYADEERLDKLIDIGHKLIKEGLIDEQTLKDLRKYKKLKIGKDRFSIEYSFSRFSYDQKGRQFVNVGLQRIIRNARNYLLNGHFVDCDMKDSQLTIAKNLFNRWNIECPKELDVYLNDREKVFEECFIDKQGFISMINRSKIIPKQPFLKSLHAGIYGEFIEKAKEEHQSLWSFIESQKGKDFKNNREGSFLSQMLGMYENDILMKACEFLKNQNYVYQTYTFDGLNIDTRKKAPTLETFSDMNAYIEKELDMKIQFRCKSMEVEQKFLDIVNEGEELCEMFQDENMNMLFDIMKNNPNTVNICDFLYAYFKNDYYYDNENKIWWFFSSHRWRTDKGESLHYKISHVIPEFFKQIDNPDKKETLVKIFGNMHQCKNLVISLQTNFSVKNDFELFEKKLEKNNHLLCFQNGVYDFQIHKFRQGKPEDYITHQMNYDYTEFNLNNLTIMELIDIISKILPNKEKRDFTLTNFSSAVAGHTSNKCEIFHGGGANGKSFLMSLLEASLGDLATSWSTALLRQEFDVNQANPELARGKNRRIINIQEGTKGGTLNMEIFKKLVGGLDKINARNLHVNGSPFVLNARLFLSLNDFPSISDNGHSVWRRIRVTEFLSTFTEDEKLVDHSKHIYLMNESYNKRIEHEFAPAFMSILIHYYKSYHEDLKVPQAIVDSTEKYRKSQDVYQKMFDDILQESPKTKMHFLQLFKACTSWAQQDGSKINRIDLVNWLTQKNYYRKCVRIGGTVSTGTYGIEIKPIKDSIQDDDEESDNDFEEV